MSESIWVVAVGVLLVAGLTLRKLAVPRERKQAPLDSNPPVAASASAERQPQPEGAKGSAWHAQHLRWVQEREAARSRAQGEILRSVQEASLALEQCAELAGANQQLQVLLDGAQDRLNRAIRDLRSAASPLGAVSLHGMSLRDGLKTLVEHVRSASPLAVEATIADSVDGLLPTATVTSVLYLTREALANAIKHGGGTRLSVRAEADQRKLVVSVADDGRGFDLQEVRPDEHQGLRKMQMRAEAARGLLQLESAQGVGTIVTLTIPLSRPQT